MKLHPAVVDVLEADKFGAGSRLALRIWEMHRLALSPTPPKLSRRMRRRLVALVVEDT